MALVSEPLGVALGVVSWSLYLVSWSLGGWSLYLVSVSTAVRVAPSHPRRLVCSWSLARRVQLVRSPSALVCSALGVAARVSWSASRASASCSPSAACAAGPLVKPLGVVQPLGVMALVSWSLCSWSASRSAG
jgi:hypothetical protein